MDYFNFYFIKKVLSKLFTKKTLIYIIIFLLIIILKSNVFAYSSFTTTVDEYYLLIERQKQIQTNFAYLMGGPYMVQSVAWVQYLKPMFDEITQPAYDFYITYTKNTSYVQYRIHCYRINDSTATLTNQDQYSQLDGTVFNVRAVKYNTFRYVVQYNFNDNSFTVTRQTGEYTIPECCLDIKSQYLIDFINIIYGLTPENQYLSSMSNSLSSIDAVNDDILTGLVDLSSTLDTISQNTSTDYSQQISQISNKISDILTDNDTIISQNNDMLEQQEQINENLEEVNDSVQELNDTISDPTVTSTASDLPDTDASDPTQSGIDSIFNSMYNAFCSGNAQDIVFPIPFTNKNITLSPYYVRDMLNDNGAGWVYTIIQAFWGYLIGRFIVYDVMKKISKIKSGNIEDIETNNIKGDML